MAFSLNPELCHARGSQAAISTRHSAFAPGRIRPAGPYNPRPIWENFRGLFHAIDKGNPRLSIPAYNGGLFAADPILDRLEVPDEVCACFRDLAAYDYRPAHEAAGSDAPGRHPGSWLWPR
jgi:hypothetical protein